jgi:hypothetical protein
LLTRTIQRQAASIPHAIAGRDILGAAKTGSGKVFEWFSFCSTVVVVLTLEINFSIYNPL